MRTRARGSVLHRPPTAEASQSTPQGPAASCCATFATSALASAFAASFAVRMLLPSLSSQPSHPGLVVVVGSSWVGRGLVTPVQASVGFAKPLKRKHSASIGTLTPVPALAGCAMRKQSTSIGTPIDLGICLFGAA